MYTFRDIEHLSSLLKQAADAHHAYEKVLGHHDEDWPTWYADYVCRHVGDAREPTDTDRCYGAACAERAVIDAAMEWGASEDPRQDRDTEERLAGATRALRYKRH